MIRILVSLAICVWLSVPSQADEVILDGKNSNSSGVKIVAGGWSATNGQGQPLHADATYNAFNSVRGGKLGPYDFYYSLEIVPQFSAQFTDCSNKPNLKTILQSLFGVTTGALILVKTDIQYRWTTGIEVDFLKNDAGLIVAGLGPSSTQAQAGFGCYFDTTLRPTFPLLQYNGGGVNDRYDDFEMKFIVVGGSAANLKVVSNVVALFGDISAAARWATAVNGLAGPAAQGGEKIAQSFQDALQAASTLQNQVSVGATLKANGGADDGRLVISIPNLFGSDQNNGNLVIYVRRTGSIALANSGVTVTPSTVFDNPALANRQCNPAAIAGGTCASGSTNITPLRMTLATQLKTVDSGLGEGTNPIVKLIDMNDTKRDKTKIYDLCRGIRTVARENLHVSTLDETLIRWAITKEGGLQDALKDAKSDPAKADALVKATGVKSLDDLATMCWNDGDEQTLEGVAQRLGKTLSN